MSTGARRHGAYCVPLTLVANASRTAVVSSVKKSQPVCTPQLARIRRGRVGLNPITKPPLSPLNTAPMQYGADSTV